MDTRTSFYDCLSDSGRFFSRDYRNARHHFLKTAEQLSSPGTAKHWSLDSQLHCDTLWLGDSNAEKVLVIISGTHGIEGYCGNAVQRFIQQGMNAGYVNVPTSCAVLMVHALNPWGMQHYRRCDQDGIDLNRNFVDFSKPLPDNHDFSHYLDQLVAADSAQRFNTLVQLANQLGQQEFDEIFSGGQYHCDWGPFYGGRQPAWSNRAIESIIDHYRLDEKLLIVIDIHSGLGPWAFGELISDHTPNSNGNAFAQQLFGQAVSCTLLGDSFSVSKRGLLDYRWHQLMHKHGCFLTLEFGSYRTEALFNVLLDDHLIWRDKNALNITEQQQQAEKMLNHFCPEEQLWQQSVLFKSWQVIQQGLTGLAGIHHD